MPKKYFLFLAALSILSMADAAFAARGERCPPESPALCYPDDCVRCYCLGPDTYGGNAPVYPRTCGVDFRYVSALYWNSHQEGLEYAIKDQITPTGPIGVVKDQIVNAEFLTPNFHANWGFKAGLGYCTYCDGWDFEVIWTWYRGKAHDKIEEDTDSNMTLITLWSAFAPLGADVVAANEIETIWSLHLNLVDFEVGRNFWTSKYLSVRPFLCVRYASLKQDFYIKHAGGSFVIAGAVPVPQLNEVDLDNDFRGAGIRTGLDSYWNVGCGFAVYGSFAASIIYGRFSIEDKEVNIQVGAPTAAIPTLPNTKTKILELEDHFHASRGILDFSLGIQWSTIFCECQYGITLSLGWEQHLFFKQNQLWRVVRLNSIASTTSPNLNGENVFYQRRGNLDTEGVTFTIKFEF